VQQARHVRLQAGEQEIGADVQVARLGEEGGVDFVQAQLADGAQVGEMVRS